MKAHGLKTVICRCVRGSRAVSGVSIPMDPTSVLLPLITLLDTLTPGKLPSATGDVQRVKITLGSFGDAI